MIRLSGPDAVAIGRRIFRSDSPLGDRIRYVEFGRALNSMQEDIDGGLAWVLKGPKSYTGEDTVEISTHGSAVVLESLVDAAIAAGATMAQPGEFTRRAFVNGNIDLMQAEAVVDLIQSESRGSMSAAYSASSGRLSKQIHLIKEMVVQALSWIEVGLDFVDEDIEPIQQRRTMDLLADIQALIDTLVATFESTRRRMEGNALVLLGKPNAGKSTLLNALVGEDRAIVATAPGTTRDTVEARVIWGGETIRLIDTAGIRADEKDPVEREGIDRTWRAAGDADCVLVVLDCTKPWDETDSEMISRLNGTPAILVINKCDLQNEIAVPSQASKGHKVFEVSAQQGTGLEQLSEATAQQLSETRNHQSIGLMRQRHHDLLTRAGSSVSEAVKSLEHHSLPECSSAALREGLRALGEMLGENVDEAILDQIFSEFCIGK